MTKEENEWIVWFCENCYNLGRTNHTTFSPEIIHDGENYCGLCYDKKKAEAEPENDLGVVTMQQVIADAMKPPNPDYLIHKRVQYTFEEIKEIISKRREM